MRNSRRTTRITMAHSTRRNRLRSRALSRKANWHRTARIRTAAVSLTSEHSPVHLMNVRRAHARRNSFAPLFSVERTSSLAMNRPQAISRWRRWRTPALIALGAWLVIEVLFIGQAMHVDAFDLWGAIKL